MVGLAIVSPIVQRTSASSLVLMANVISLFAGAEKKISNTVLMLES